MRIMCYCPIDTSGQPCPYTLYKVAAALSGPLSLMHSSSRDGGLSLDPADLISFPSCDFNHFNMSNKRPSADGTEEQRRKYRCHKP